MGNIVKEYLTFTSKERSGLIVLLSSIVAVLVFLNLDFDPELKDETDLSQFEKELEALTVANSYSGTESSGTAKAEDKGRTGSDDDQSSYKFHEFDPNYVTDEEWKEMGLKKWQINGLRSYREKAGDIRSAEQFSKLNVITEEFFAKVESYLRFEERTEKGTINKHIKSEDTSLPVVRIELNSATPDMLRKLKGIGPAFSKRIVKYRKGLGGFNRMDQLLEVYGLKDSLFDVIIPFLTLDSTRISTININSVMISELRKHPYVKWNIANGIVNYRDQHGPYETVSAIKQTDLVSDELYRKIAPYLVVKSN